MDVAVGAQHSHTLAAAADQTSDSTTPPQESTTPQPRPPPITNPTQRSSQSKPKKKRFQCQRQHFVSLFWVEKCWIILETCQIFALLWSLSRPWPWPFSWRKATLFFNAFTLDPFAFLSFQDLDALDSGRTTAVQRTVWGETDSYWIIPTVYMSVVCGIAVILLGLVAWHRRGTPKNQRLRQVIGDFAFIALRFLYVPVCLALVRVFGEFNCLPCRLSGPCSNVHFGWPLSLL